MLKKILAGASLSVIAVTLAYAQAQAPAAGGAQAPAAAGRSANPRDLPGGALAAGGRGADANLQRSLPSENQWDNMNAKGKAFVAKAKELAGNDPDLVFDQGIFCKASGGSQNSDRANLGKPVGAVYEAVGSPSPARKMGPMHMFDNFWYFGTTGVGAWLITSNDGYILFDAGNDADEAQDIIVDGMKSVGLDPTKIKVMVFGHNHLDHTGGGHLIETIAHPRIIMGKEDWPLYFNAVKSTTGQGANLGDKTPMTHSANSDAVDGEKITVGDVTATIYTMKGHTPGSIGMIVPVKWQGTNHNILIVTAGTDAKNRDDFVNGYEHIWDKGIAARVESVIQVHPNTNMNSIGRLEYVNKNYATLSKSGQNPMLYGVDKTRRYIDIMRNCTLARFEALGW
jgi:metallo-beta-lactamase class B